MHYCRFIVPVFFFTVFCRFLCPMCPMCPMCPKRWNFFVFKNRCLNFFYPGVSITFYVPMNQSNVSIWHVPRSWARALLRVLGTCFWPIRIVGTVWAQKKNWAQFVSTNQNRGHKRGHNILLAPIVRANQMCPRLLSIPVCSSRGFMAQNYPGLSMFEKKYMVEKLNIRRFD